MDWFLETGTKVIGIIVIAVVAFMLVRRLTKTIVKQAISHYMEDEDKTEIRRRTNTLTTIIRTTSGIIIAILALFMILPLFGVDPISLVASLGIGGLAISFAAQHLVRDFITGFFIIFEDQYRIKDDVCIAGIEGTVEELGLRRTVIRDSNGYLHSIPNEKVEISTNLGKKFSRVNMNITVGYGENLKRVINTINKVCEEMAEDPEWKDDFITTPSVLRIDKLGDSGIDIKIRGDTKIFKQKPIMGELRLRLKNTFDKEDIEIPWPHTKVYFGSTIPVGKEN